MKRILIAIHYLEIGGAETALTGLLNAIDYTRVDVDLFLYSHRGEMLAYVPKEVNLLPEIPEYAQIERPIKQVLKDGYLRIALARLKAKIQSWRYLRRRRVAESTAVMQYAAEALSPLLPQINPSAEYDLAISFLNPHNIVRDKVRARKKACWIHNDYSVVDVNAEQELPVWSAFDSIISISESVTKAFLKAFPSLADKVVLMENILLPSFIRKRADEFDVTDQMRKDPGICLLSVGRFSHQKNYDNVPQICRSIVEAGIANVKWYIIGYGKDERLMRLKIAQSGMEDHVIILGKKTNPYPYIKACDIFVQPSRYEGKSIAVREAQILCKPVVATNYPTPSSQIADGIDGVLAPMDNDGCARAIVNFIGNKAKQEAIIQYLRTHDYGLESEVEKLYTLI